MPPRAPKAPAPPSRLWRPALALDSDPTLADRIAAVRGDGPDLQRRAKAAGWPSGISPEVSWALKRLERWEKGDERPVRVVVLTGKRCPPAWMSRCPMARWSARAAPEVAGEAHPLSPHHDPLRGVMFHFRAPSAQRCLP